MIHPNDPKNSKTQQAVAWLLAAPQRSQVDASRMFDVSQPAISQALARRDKTRIGNAERIRLVDAVLAERKACAAVCETLADRCTEPGLINALRAAGRNILARDK